MKVAIIFILVHNLKLDREVQLYSTIRQNNTISTSCLSIRVKSMKANHRGAKSEKTMDPRYHTSPCLSCAKISRELGQGKVFAEHKYQ